MEFYNKKSFYGDIVEDTSINLVWAHCRGLANTWETDVEGFWAGEMKVVFQDKWPNLNVKAEV